MKCKFEHDEDCCNWGSPQYMCKCKPDVCNNIVSITNADRIRSMSDEELLDFMIKTIGNAALCKMLRTEPKFCTLDWLRQPAEEETP